MGKLSRALLLSVLVISILVIVAPNADAAGAVNKCIVGEEATQACVCGGIDVDAGGFCCYDPYKENYVSQSVTIGGKVIPVPCKPHCQIGYGVENTKGSTKAVDATGFITDTCKCGPNSYSGQPDFFPAGSGYCCGSFPNDAFSESACEAGTVKPSIDLDVRAVAFDDGAQGFDSKHRVGKTQIPKPIGQTLLVRSKLGAAESCITGYRVGGKTYKTLQGMVYGQDLSNKFGFTDLEVVYDPLCEVCGLKNYYFELVGSQEVYGNEPFRYYIPISCEADVLVAYNSETRPYEGGETYYLAEDNGFEPALRRYVDVLAFEKDDGSVKPLASYANVPPESFAAGEGLTVKYVNLNNADVKEAYNLELKAEKTAGTTNSVLTRTDKVGLPDASFAAFKKMLDFIQYKTKNSFLLLLGGPEQIPVPVFAQTKDSYNNDKITKTYSDSCYGQVGLDCAAYDKRRAQIHVGRIPLWLGAKDTAFLTKVLENNLKPESRVKLVDDMLLVGDDCGGKFDDGPQEITVDGAKTTVNYVKHAPIEYVSQKGETVTKDQTYTRYLLPEDKCNIRPTFERVSRYFTGVSCESNPDLCGYNTEYCFGKTYQHPRRTDPDPEFDANMQLYGIPPEDVRGTRLPEYECAPEALNKKLGQIDFFYASLHGSPTGISGVSQKHWWSSTLFSSSYVSAAYSDRTNAVRREAKERTDAIKLQGEPVLSLNGCNLANFLKEDYEVEGIDGSITLKMLDLGAGTVVAPTYYQDIGGCADMAFAAFGLTGSNRVGASLDDSNRICVGEHECSMRRDAPGSDPQIVGLYGDPTRIIRFKDFWNDGTIDVRNVPVLTIHHPIAALNAEKITSTTTKEQIRKYLQPLEKIFEYLNSHDYKSMSFDELAAKKNACAKDATKCRVPKKSFVLSVDDGYITAYTHLFPLLEVYGVKANLFVPVGKIVDPEGASTPEEKEKLFEFEAYLNDLGRRASDTDEESGRQYAAFVNIPQFYSDEPSYPKLTWGLIREMEASGLVKTYSHSYALDAGVSNNYYPYEALLQANKKEGMALITADIKKARTLLEARLGGKRAFLAWPNGMYSEDAIKAAEAAGVPRENQYGFTSHSLTSITPARYTKNERVELDLKLPIPTLIDVISVGAGWNYGEEWLKIVIIPWVERDAAKPDMNDPAQRLTLTT